MCGIIGYVGNKDVTSVLMAGLWKLEYRGYDSAGIAVISDGELVVKKSCGRLMKLQELLDKEPVSGNVGIGHTRWATHGEPSDQNAHPQVDCKGKIAVVHNGIIENYYSLKEKLIKEKHIFKSNTDTEVIAHLVEKYMKGNLFEAVRKAVQELEGSYAIAVISEDEPDRIVAVRKGSPLVIGLGKDENLLASDIPAMLGHTRKMVILSDGDMAVLTREKVEIFNEKGERIEREITTIPWDLEELDRGEYPHFMLKEIHEQPEVIRKNIKLKLKNGKIDFGEAFNFEPRDFVNVGRIIIQACGTSWHAGYVGKYLLEELARVHTEVDISSEFRYRNPVVSGETLVIAISQSGETADTLAGLREAKAKFLRVLSVVNVVGSTIARESDGVIYIHAGPEIGVASTKAYTAQLFSLYLFSLYLARIKWTLDEEEVRRRLDEVKKIPELMERILEREEEIKKIAKRFYRAKNFMFLGRGINYPSALEGALKLKEISYIHATGYPAGEMKHGPIALIDKKTPVVAIAPASSVYEKMLNNIEEVKARGGRVIAIATEGDRKIKRLADYVFYIPEVPEELSPMLVALPLQLLAYHIAVLNGRDVDKPRNLAKSVTVE